MVTFYRSQISQISQILKISQILWISQRKFFEENEGADRCFYCFSIIVVQVHTWAFIMTLMTPELTLT